MSSEEQIESDQGIPPELFWINKQKDDLMDLRAIKSTITYMELELERLDKKRAAFIKMINYYTDKKKTLLQKIKG